MAEQEEGSRLTGVSTPPPSSRSTPTPPDASSLVETTGAVLNKNKKKDSKASSSFTRRSARVLNHDPVVAPGFGTRKDIERLSGQLSSGNVNFPPEAVLEMMSVRGRGLRTRGGGGTAEDDTNAAVASAADASSSLWADFMKEEGVSVDPKTAASSRGEPDRGTSTKKNKASAVAATSSSKKAKTASASAGILVQTGTLDSSIVGREKLKSGKGKEAMASTSAAPYHLMVPTVLLPSVKIARVFTGCNAVHSLALDATGTLYGWGRNESGQLGSHLPANVLVPTRILDGAEGPLASSMSSSPTRITSAAMGKSHTLLLDSDGHAWAVGSNKVGQCGVQKAGESVPNFRQCTLPTNVNISQIACGEDFSAALDSDGTLYTTGSSEYGQLANGETGEYFVSANKLAFANCQVFTPRRVFVHAPGEKLHTTNEHCKTTQLPESSAVSLAAIACGKHHGLAVERAPVGSKPRVFSWGCGNYGCLGHGVQADEYHPRLIGLLLTLPVSTSDGDDVLVSAGAHCSLLQTPSGHVYYWGKHRSVGEAVMRPQLVDALANNGHVVTHCGAGGQTVVCCTASTVVAWGQGPHGELGLADKKSSAKPTFVPSLEGKSVLDVACGYGHTLYVLEDASDLPKLDPDVLEYMEKPSSKKSK